jgi:hypothetical protein
MVTVDRERFAILRKDTITDRMRLLGPVALNLLHGSRDHGNRFWREPIKAI